MIIYVTVVATGNVRHDYYQTLTVPVLCIFMSMGAVYLYGLSRTLSGKIKSIALISVLFLFMEMFGWYYVRDYFNINHPEIVEAGQAVELLTPPNSLVIAPYNGDTAFLYQTRRAGWPIMEKSVDEMIKMGADYYVSVNFDELTKKLMADATNPIAMPAIAAGDCAIAPFPGAAMGPQPEQGTMRKCPGTGIQPAGTIRRSVRAPAITASTNAPAHRFCLNPLIAAAI